MDEESKFWLTLWKYALIAFCVVVISGVASCQNTKYQLRKMSEKHDPIKSACALHYGDNNGDSAVCGIFAAYAK